MQNSIIDNCMCSTCSEWEVPPIFDEWKWSTKTHYALVYVRVHDQFHWIPTRQIYSSLFFPWSEESPRCYACTLWWISLTELRCNALLKGAMSMVLPFLPKIDAILQMMRAVFCMLENVLITSVLPKRALWSICVRDNGSLDDWSGRLSKNGYW